MEDFSRNILLGQSLALKSEWPLHSAEFPEWGVERTWVEAHCPASRPHSQGRYSGEVQTDRISPPWWGVCIPPNKLVGLPGGCEASVHSLSSGRSGTGWWPGHWSLQSHSCLSGSLETVQRMLMMSCIGNIAIYSIYGYCNLISDYIKIQGIGQAPQ